MDIDPVVRDRYLDRLGVEGEPPSLDGLCELHRRHAERVPYETLWIHGGERWDIDAHRAANRIALDGRGGYCYHLNGAFGLLLSSLGSPSTVSTRWLPLAVGSGPPGPWTPPMWYLTR